MTRCGRCRERAVIEVRRHSTAFCRDCFLHYVRGQVSRAIDKYKMIARDDRVLVAVSGGKDSLALWDLLLALGYSADGLYLGLGIGGYSERSGEVCRAFADARGAKLLVHDLAAEQGFTVPQAVGSGGRSSCSVCGLSKRYVFNAEALAGGYDVVATGHNLDDEAAVLLGNTLRWDTVAMARQFPVLQATRPGLVKKVKPLYRLSEHDTASYAVIRGIDYVVEECPNAVGAKSLLYKDALNLLEARSPGTKQGFLLGFLEKGRAGFAESDEHELRPCIECEQPTTTERCAFCRLVADTKRPGRPPRRHGRRRPPRRNDLSPLPDEVGHG